MVAACRTGICVDSTPGWARCILKLRIRTNVVLVLLSSSSDGKVQVVLAHRVSALLLKFNRYRHVILSRAHAMRLHRLTFCRCNWHRHVPCPPWLNAYSYWCLLISRPDVHFHCNIDYDPFMFMQEKEKVYCKQLDFFYGPTVWYLGCSIHDHDVRIRSHNTNALGSCHGSVVSVLRRSLSWCVCP